MDRKMARYSFVAVLILMCTLVAAFLVPGVARAEETESAPAQETTAQEAQGTTDESDEEDAADESAATDEAAAEEASTDEAADEEASEEEATSEEAEEEPALMLLMAAGDTTWQDDWDYELNEDAGTIRIYNYNGSESELVIPAKAIVDGVEYTTLYGARGASISTSNPLKNGTVKKVSFEEGVKAPVDCNSLFSGYGLEELDVSNLDTSETTSMTYMFAYMNNLTSLTVNGMDTSNVTNMRYMFYQLTNLAYLDVSQLDTTAANYDTGGAQTSMFVNFGGYLFDGVVDGTGAFENNQRDESAEYRYPGYSYNGNYGITGPEGAERVWCLNSNRSVPSSNYFKLITQEEYLGDAYKKSGEKSLTEDDLAKIAAAIIYESNAPNRSVVQNSIWDVTNGSGNGTRYSDPDFRAYFNTYVLPNYEAIKGLYDMHIYASENTQYQNLVGITRAYYSGALLTIIKETAGEPEGMERGFDLTLTVTVDGEPYTGRISTRGVTDKVEDMAIDLDENGQATFTIYDGETFQIFNLPVGAEYTVEEASKGYKLTGENLEATVSDGQTICRLNNEYAPEGTVIFTGTKTLEGREFKAGDEFTFTLTGEDGAPLPEVTTVTLTPESGTSVSFAFDEITFTKEDIGKTYTYTVTESGSGDGITNDSATHTITVTITDPEDETRELLVTCEYSDGEELSFVNTYTEEKKEEAKQEEKKDDKKTATLVPKTADPTMSVNGLVGLGAALSMLGLRKRKNH